MESVMAGVEYFLRYQSLSLWALLFTILIGFVGILLWHVHNLKLQQISISLDVLDVDLSTKVFAVTGASSGLGAAITKELYRRNAIVLMLASKWSNAVEIKAEITANLSSSGYLTVVHVDFSSFESIERCAEKVKRYVPHLDGLFNNIAAELCEREITKNDMEYVQQVSAIGHLTLTQLLLPALTTACGRVVSISSILSKTSGSPNVDEISYVRETYKDVQAYSRSKLLISIITLKLAQRSSDIRFFSTDPGITEMPLWSIFTTFFFSQNGPYFLQTLCSKMHRTVGISPTQAALRVIALGFSPMFDKYSGGHLHNYCFCEVHPMMKELEKIDDIWNAIKEKLSDARFFCDRVPSLMDLQDVDLDKKKKSGEDSQGEFELRKGLKKRFISSKNLFVRQKDP